MKLSKEHSAAPEHPPMATPPGPNGIRVGIDLGGTKIEIIGLAQDQRVVLQKRFSTPRGRYRAIIEALAAAVEFAEFNTKETLHRPLGLGTPGAVSHKTGRMKNCNTTELNGRDLVKDLSQVLQRPVKIANDADCFTLSEAIDGAGQNHTAVFGVILGTGVGGGLAVHQKLLTGPNAITGEWGHNLMPLARLKRQTDFPWSQGRICYCGQQDCIETWLSGPGLAMSFKELTGTDFHGAHILQNPTQSPATQAIFDQYSQLCALALSTIINSLDPDIIVLGGGLSNIPGLCEAIRSHWTSYVFSDKVDTMLACAAHGDASGVRGAAYLWS
ncbi:ROK family protein [bacterium]|jgi:fructokinase|nr:ROK family protein [bacterium]